MLACADDLRTSGDGICGFSALRRSVKLMPPASPPSLALRSARVFRAPAPGGGLSPSTLVDEALRSSLPHDGRTSSITGGRPPRAGVARGLAAGRGTGTGALSWSGCWPLLVRRWRPVLRLLVRSRRRDERSFSLFFGACAICRSRLPCPRSSINACTSNHSASAGAASEGEPSIFQHRFTGCGSEGFRVRLWLGYARGVSQ
jgi:hypothetical protein